MPSKTPDQAVAMAIACKHPEKSTSGIPQDVACEFNRADKGGIQLKKGNSRKKIRLRKR